MEIILKFASHAEMVGYCRSVVAEIDGARASFAGEGFLSVPEWWTGVVLGKTADMLAQGDSGAPLWSTRTVGLSRRPREQQKVRHFSGTPERPRQDRHRLLWEGSGRLDGGLCLLRNTLMSPGATFVARVPQGTWLDQSLLCLPASAEAPAHYARTLGLDIEKVMVLVQAFYESEIHLAWSTQKDQGHNYTKILLGGFQLPALVGETSVLRANALVAASSYYIATRAAYAEANDRSVAEVARLCTRGTVPLSMKGLRASWDRLNVLVAREYGVPPGLERAKTVVSLKALFAAEASDHA